MRPRHVVTAIALLFFALPIGLRLTGMHAHAFENHAFAPRPTLSAGFDAFPQMTMFFKDRMPGREQAVKANNRISMTAFGTVPSYGAPAVAPASAAAPVAPPAGADTAVQGRAGWLFLGSELTAGCASGRFDSLDGASTAWRKLIGAVQARGKRTVFVIAPDKSTIYPEHLPANFATKDCLARDRADLWRRIEASAGRNVLPLRQTLLRAKSEHPEGLYYRTDSHWNPVGDLYMTRAILSNLSGSVTPRPDELRVASAKRPGDLSLILGRSDRERVPVISVVRAPNAATVPGRALLVGDSFGEEGLKRLRPYFRHLDFMNWTAGPAAIAARVAAVDIVIMEVVERGYTYWTRKTFPEMTSRIGRNR